MTAPLLSVVVIGRNEGERLRQCLASVVHMKDLDEGLEGDPERGVEIIYVDSGSTDGSPELAADFGAKVIVLNAEHPTAALGRNAGWAEARAEQILFLDGDTVLHPEFPRAASAALLADPSVAAVWGHRRELRPDFSIYNRVLDLDWIYPAGDSLFCGGDVLMRKKVLEEAGGYDATLIAGEEPELCRRLRLCGYRILHIDQPMTGHDLAMTSGRSYWKRALRTGHAYAELSTRFAATEDPLWLAESRANRRRGAFWLVAAAAALLISPVTPIAMLLVLSLFLFASVRSARNARWKVPPGARGRNALLFWYGIHSQLQQIPIFLGQLGYWRDQQSGKRRKLIEYRGDAGRTGKGASRSVVADSPRSYVDKE